MKIKIIEKEETITIYSELSVGDIFSFKESNKYSEQEDIILRLSDGYINLTQLISILDLDGSDRVNNDTEIIKHELIEFTVKRG